MRPDHEALALAALLAIALCGLVSAARRALGRARLRARFRRARRGERVAERLLEARGYRIEARQASRAWHPEVDGRRHTVEVRADLVVSKRGKRYVAEVKTGAVAPDIGYAPTRRQLLEYQHAFRADGVLLVAPEADEVRAIGFPDGRAPSDRLRLVALGFVLGSGLGAALTWALLARR
jgi:hypothetical protein